MAEPTRKDLDRTLNMRIQLTPEKRAKMLRMAEQKYREDGHRGHDAKKLARLALSRFIQEHNAS